jgi:hypothetical protein
VRIVQGFNLHANLYGALICPPSSRRILIASEGGVYTQLPAWQQWARRFFHRRATRMLVNSQAVKRYVDEIPDERPGWSKVVWNGVDTAWFDPAIVPLHLREQKRWAVNARYSYVAGHRDFVLDEAAFGTDRSRWQSATELQSHSGIAPVTERSGKALWVHHRLACPKFVKQTFHEFADQSIRFSQWARTYYDQQRGRGNDHHAALRSLAYKWIRILFRCWKDGKPYDEATYMDALRRHGSSLVKNNA